MKTLIVSATKIEIEPFLSTKRKDVDILETGVGMVNTTFELTKKLMAEPYDYVVNVGIAGSLDKSVPLGTVCNVREDFFTEIGFETPEGDFNSFSDSSLVAKNEIFTYASENANFHPYLNTLLQASGITVNTVHGNKNSIEKLQRLLKSQKFQHKTILESMEGAAVFYVCEKMNIKSVQLRAVSNYVEERDTGKWNIPVAIKNLNECLLNIFISNE